MCIVVFECFWMVMGHFVIGVIVVIVYSFDGFVGMIVNVVCLFLLELLLLFVCFDNGVCMLLIVVEGECFGVNVLVKG